MGKTFLQKTIEFQFGSQHLETVVIANRLTDAIHPSASAYLLNKRFSGGSIKSLIKYASIILSLIEEIEFDPELNDFDDLTDNDMSNYLEFVLMGDRGNKASTIMQVELVLSDFYKFINNHGFAKKGDRFSFVKSKEATIKMAKSVGRKNSHDPFRLSERYIPPNQFSLLLSYENSKDLYLKERNSIILRLGYEVGLRAFEITSFNNFSVSDFKMALKESQIKKINEVELRILGKRNKVRTIIIEPNLRRKIQSFIQKYEYRLNNQLICSRDGKELNKEYATTIFRRSKKNLIKKADLKHADRWSSNYGWQFHANRHSYATNIAIKIESGDKKLGRSYLMDRLGHSHQKTTIIYLHFAAAMLGKIREQDEYEMEMRQKKFTYDNQEFEF